MLCLSLTFIVSVDYTVFGVNDDNNLVSLMKVLVSLISIFGVTNDLFCVINSVFLSLAFLSFVWLKNHC